MPKKDGAIQVSGLQTMLTFSGTLVILTGAITLLGWITNFQFLINFIPRYVPMAPSNSIFFILFGLVFVSGENALRKKCYRISILVIISICSLYGLLQFVGKLIDTDLNFDFTLFPVKEKLGNFPIGHMSPYAGLIFFASGIAILSRAFITDRGIIQNIIGGIGIMVALSGFVAGLGYLFGTPFLYSGNIIPLSVRTAISFVFLGFGLLFMAGENTVFLRQLIGPTPDARLLRVLIPIIISVFLLEGVLDVIFTHYYKINEGYCWHY